MNIAVIENAMMTDGMMIRSFNFLLVSSQTALMCVVCNL
jgi:hypothetical protein